MPTLHRTIVRPLITEKTSAAYQNRGEYVFEVHPDATKSQIRNAIEQLFGVKVTGVWTMNVRGKEKRMGRNVGRRPNWKKAIVKLREGDTIEQVFEA
jgi:large subunit ribosomal protein L23